MKAKYFWRLGGLISFLCALFLMGASTFAADEPEGAPALAKRLYTLGGKHEVAPLLGVTLNDKFTQHMSVSISYTYHISEDFAIELAPGYVLGDETSITDKIRTTQAERLKEVNSEVLQMNRISWFAAGDVQWSPFYGKMSLGADIDARFSAFIYAGGGMAGKTRENFNPCFDAPGMAGCATDLHPELKGKVAGTLPIAEVGGGFRFFIDDTFMLRAEIRDHIGFDTLKVERKYTPGYEPGKGAPDELINQTDISNFVFATLGVGILL